MGALLSTDGREIVLDGQAYTTVLAEIHRIAAPRTYLEIGTASGDTLRLARCRSVAVDPAFTLSDPSIAGPNVVLREMISDDYFARHRPRDDLKGPVDFAFLDGMHEFPFLLRDFINTERAAATHGVIAMHDCIPLDAHMTRLFKDFTVKAETRHPDLWTGDVWKMIPVLRQYRPDLDLNCLDAPLTGLVVCRGLDPRNRVLSDNYAAILAAWTDVTLAEYGMERLFAAAAIGPSRSWLEKLTPMHPGPMRRLGRWIQPRRRLLNAVAALLPRRDGTLS